MAEVIIMPKLGFNMNTGKLVEWYKQEGDEVKKGEPLFSVETDKTNMDIEATGDGVVKKLLIDAGDEIPVTLPIAVIGSADENAEAVITDAVAQLEGEGVASVAASTLEDAPAASEPVCKAKDETAEGGRIKVTPRARRVAAEHGISPEEAGIQGTGWDGGICEKDILEYIASNRIKATPVAKAVANAEGISLKDMTGSGVNGRIMKADVMKALSEHESAEGIASARKERAEDTAAEFTEDGKEILEIVPYAGVRKVIGDRLSYSKFTAPHLYFTQTVNLEKLLEVRKQINEMQEKKTSVTDYIVRAAVIALQQYPDLNASLDADRIIKYKSVNIGIAVASPTGLIVPNIKEAQDMSVVEISRASTPLFEKARQGKLAVNEYSGGTFTVSNLGMFGIENFTAIINPPEVGILAVSATKDEPVVVVNSDGGKEIAIKPMMKIQLTVDHRVIDGLMAAQFVTEIKNMLENPIRLLI